MLDKLIARMTRRKPDVIIGGRFNPYMLRWFVIPRNRLFNIYLHKFMRSDDDRALHDHPWMNCSFVLRGACTEHTIAAGGVSHRAILPAGSVRMRLTGRIAHRIELHEGPCWTLFITGPRYRNWGFHCPEAGWVPWEQFVAVGDNGSIGRGCGE